MDTLDVPGKVNARCLDYLLMEMVSTSISISHQKGDPVEIPDPTRTINILDQNFINSDDVTLRNENYGFQVGIRLSELLLHKAPASSPKISNILDIMKFVCRDVWRCLYGKQMDNLRTNHRGIFVLVDNNCRLISSMNSAKGVPDSIARARTFLWFPCGLIRGILQSFGIEALVTAEITSFPAVTFNIQTSINN
ncbi:trafficking protein particle complex subunit 33 [[Candida] anglica]|uniref:Trafficking protein particle complex subunit 33 n=1 Tax=[Candida] anglica TaxID=148631 RepID=A0ABP0EA99_9ASCO